MKEISAFFNGANTISDIDQENGQQFNYLDCVKAFAIATYSSIYVIDYMKQGFEYVSDNPLFLCGNTATQVQEMGYNYYFKYVPEKDLELLLKINTVGFEFYEKVPLKDRGNHSISYDFHLRNQEGKLILINQKLTPIFFNNEGKIWKALCVVSLSSERTEGNIRIHKSGENKVYTYDLQENVWRPDQKMKLSDRETEILQLSVRGHTINEISEMLFVSPDTVKFHRRKLFEKMGVNSMTEAISYAVNNNLNIFWQVKPTKS